MSRSIVLQWITAYEGKKSNVNVREAWILAAYLFAFPFKLSKQDIGESSREDIFFDS